MTDVVTHEDHTTVVEEADHSVRVITECVQGPPGPTGGSVDFPASVIPASQTGVVAQIAANAARSVKWVVGLERLGMGQYRAVEILAVQAQSAVDFTVYAQVGDTLAVAYAVAVVGGQLTLSITNNTLDSVRVTGTQVQVAPV